MQIVAVLGLLRNNNLDDIFVAMNALPIVQYDKDHQPMYIKWDDQVHNKVASTLVLALQVRVLPSQTQPLLKQFLLLVPSYLLQLKMDGEVLRQTPSFQSQAQPFLTHFPLPL